MAESTSLRDNLIVLDQESEGNSIGSDDFIFKKIGESIPLKAPDSEFELERVPVEGLAVSDRFGVVFLAHSEGFCIARTKDVIELAKEVKEEGKNSRNIQESGILDILIGSVTILALSTDSSMLAACVGGDIFFFSVTSLLNKDKAPSFSCSLSESGNVKDFRWKKDVKNSFLVLSSCGMLYHGDVGGSLEDLMDTVDAVDWGVEGDYIAVARKSTLSILSSEIKEEFKMSLLFQSWDIDLDEKGIIKVDSIRWLRSDSIIIGCLKSTEDGNEDSYLLQVIANCGHKITEASKLEVFSFGELFSCIVDDIVPFGSGPYLYANYLERWELMVAANRKNTDQHIVLLGWSYTEKKGKPVAIEFKQDKQVPRIELSDSGDDNLIVGFGIDKVSLYEKVKFERDAEHKELSPYCMLLCLTSDGKLVMFHVARISDIAVQPQVSSLPSNNITGGIKELSASMNSSLITKDNKEGIVVLDGKSGQISNQSSGSILQEKDPTIPQLKLSDKMPGKISEKVVVCDEIPKENASQVAKQKISSRTSSDADQLFTVKNNESILMYGSACPDSSSVIANKEIKSLDNIQKPEVNLQFNDLLAKQKQADAAGNLTGNASALKHQSYNVSVKSNEVSKGFTEMTGSPGFGTTQSGYVPEGKFSNSNDINARSSPFAPVASTQSDGQKGAVISMGSTKQPANQSFPPTGQSGAKTLNLKVSAQSPPSSIFSSGKPAQVEGQRATGAGNAASTSLSQGFSGVSREDSIMGKQFNSKGTHNLNYQKINRSRGALDSEQESSKSYINFLLQISEMTKELDALLSDIEEEGGFRDECILRQRNSVLELEKGLENLSEACRVWKNKLNERFGDVEHLRDQITQVLAKKVYIEGIVKEASNSQYWELWNRQKLSPEFEMRRQQIIKMNQNLMNQIIELERHFNIIELNKFGDYNRASMRQRTFGNSSESSRQVQALHSLHNTMNSQLAAAEQLSDCLSKQVSALKIESPPVKKHGLAKELFDSIDLPYDGHSFHSPELKRSSRTPESIKKLSLPSFSAIKEPSRKNMSSSLKAVEPETARRRRDSLDRSLASFEPQKTTVKRMLLEERSRVNKDKSFGAAKQSFGSQLEDGFSILSQKDQVAPSSFDLQMSIYKQHSNTHPSNKGIQVKPLTQPSEPSSAALFKWSKDSAGTFETGGSKSSPMQVMQQGSPQSLLSTSRPSPFGTIQNNTQEASVSDKQSSFGSIQVVQFDRTTSQALSISETKLLGSSEAQDKTPSKTTSTILSMKNGSPRKELHARVQARDLSNSNRREDVQTKQTTGSMKQGGGTPISSVPPEKVNASMFTSVPAISPFAGLTRNTNQFNMLMSEIQSGETASVGTFSSSPSLSSLASTPTIPSSSGNSAFQTPSQTKDTDSEPVPNPRPAQALATVSEVSVSAGPSSASLASSSSTASTLSIFSAAPIVSLNSQPEKPSSMGALFSTPSNTTANMKNDVALIQEDEMEEESPDTAELTLGSLGGFGLGSNPASSAPKPNPFGVSLAAPINHMSSPFSLSVPSGELFRPASFNFPSSTPQSSQPINQGAFSGGLGNMAASPSHTGSGFGQPAQIGAGQQALGSVLGAFGQSRQLGPGMPGVGFAAATSGFGAAAKIGGPGSTSGFAGAATGGGFAGIASAGGGFAGVGSTGSGFASVGGGGGFAGAGGGGGGFAGAGGGGGGFAGAASTSGGFGAFSNPQASGGFSTFGGSSAMASGKPPELFTQMRR